MNRYLTCAALILTAACAREGNEAASNNVASEAPAGASLKKADGADAGLVTLAENGQGVTIKVEASGLTPGDHGLHLHTVGRCEGPKFDSAGPHWNPTGKKHGRDNPAGAHLGDLANLSVGADGRGSATFTVEGVTLKGSVNPLVDLDGAALVVHAKADDYKTDPSGDSGDRIACAILAG